MYTSNKTLLQILVEELPHHGGWPEGTSRISQGAVTGNIYADGHRVLFRHNVYGGEDCVTRDQYEAALAASKAVVGHNGWINWAGGECPVDGDAIVEVKLRNTNRHEFNSDRAGDFDWSHDGFGCDIIAYRLRQPQEAEQNESCDEADLNDCIGQAVPVPARWPLLADIHSAGIKIDLESAVLLADYLIDAGYRKQ